MRAFLSKHSTLMSRGNDYSIVAILGAQSSGKSTLLNLLFNTEFKVMDAARGRARTTHGVWLGVPSNLPAGSLSQHQKK